MTPAIFAPESRQSATIAASKAWVAALSSARTAAIFPTGGAIVFFLCDRHNDNEAVSICNQPKTGTSGCAT